MPRAWPKNVKLFYTWHITLKAGSFKRYLEGGCTGTKPPERSGGGRGKLRGRTLQGKREWEAELGVGLSGSEQGEGWSE